MVTELKKDTFKDFISKGTVLVDFYADWCEPCQRMKPVMEELAEKHPEFSVGKMNVDEDVSVTLGYKIDSIPAVIAFRDGVEFKRFIGYRPMEYMLVHLK